MGLIAGTFLNNYLSCWLVATVLNTRKKNTGKSDRRNQTRKRIIHGLIKSVCVFFGISDGFFCCLFCRCFHYSSTNYVSGAVLACIVLVLLFSVLPCQLFLFFQLNILMFEVCFAIIIRVSEKKRFVHSYLVGFWIFFSWETRAEIDYRKLGKFSPEIHQLFA